MPHGKRSRQISFVHRPAQRQIPARAVKEERKRLELVVKCDSAGSVEAVNALLKGLKIPEAEIDVIYSGVGSVSKSDLLMALSGSRLVLGFNVNVMPQLEHWTKEHDVEVRIYDVIYKISEDLRRICASFKPPEIEEKIIGKAKVIALFKSSPGAIILGCQVVEGSFLAGKDFRVISAMGTVYTGKIESIHIEKKAVKEARTGQQAGLKIEGFNQARIGDLVECFEKTGQGQSIGWRPTGSIIAL